MLHDNPERAARMLCDRHLTSQSKETVQILYTAFTKMGVPLTEMVQMPDGTTERPWKPVWNHPCVDWVMSGIDALLWTIKHGEAIVDEFEQRYGHKLKASYHLAFLRAHFNQHGFKGQKSAADWLASLDEATRQRVGPRVGFLLNEYGDYAEFDHGELAYAVVAMDPEFVVKDDQDHIDCVESYMKFYTHKAKHQFVMKWRRELKPPTAIAEAFARHDRDTPPLALRPSKKRKLLDDEAAFPEMAAFTSVTGGK